jgi:hypothetical protein
MAGDVIVCMATRVHRYSGGWLVAGVLEGRRGFLEWRRHLPQSVTGDGGAPKHREGSGWRSRQGRQWPAESPKSPAFCSCATLMRKRIFFLCALVTSACVYSCGLIWNHRYQVGGKLHQRFCTVHVYYQKASLLRTHSASTNGTKF